MISLGWIVWDSESNEPYRATNGSGWRERRVPPKVYPTAKRAIAYAPEGKTVRQVFVAGGTPTIEQLLTGEAVQVIYTNWRGVTELRTLRVDHIWRGTTEFHPGEPQILVKAVDLDRGVERDFALKDMVIA
jgi:hypothetical protein